ncbi:MAG: ABC transporter permease [Clostridia bacterium]|nr:ABC transporter permease [Clostridia bacterium]
MVKKAGKSLKYVYLGLMLFFLYIPIIYLIVFSFNNFGTGRRVSYTNIGAWKGFTLSNYSNIFTGEAGKALLLTLEIAAISSVAATVIGTAAAIGIYAMKKGPRNVILNVSQLPMVNPDLVTGITFMMLFAFVNSLLAKLNIGQIGDIPKLVIAHVTFSIPYVIFSVMPRLRQSSGMLYEAAMDLGCSPTKALMKVVIPDIMPGISSGFIMALTMSLDDFVVSYFVSDLSSVLSVYIYSSARGTKGVNPALATVIFIPLVTLLLIVNLRRLSKEREYEIQSKKVKMKDKGGNTK